MDNQMMRREVQRCDDPFGIPACFYWSVDEVADWIESIGYGKYKENFRSHFINGRKLLTVDACTLPKLGIVHFGDILTIAKIIRYQLGVDETKKVKYDPWTKRGAYMNPTKESGRRQPALSYKRFAMKYERALDSRMKYFKKKGLCYVGWSMHPSWDKNIIEEERIVNEAIEGFKWLNGKPKYQIGKTLQERLLNTNLREMDPEAEAKKPINIVKDTSRRSSSSNHSQSSNRSRSRIQKRSSASSSITSGRLLITREDRMVLKREKDVMNMHVEKRKECPFLPIIFCWDQMEPSTGYPQLKVETEKDMCGISKKE